MSASTLAQLRFLTNAAHLLRPSAPETSAYLMARRAEYAVLHQEQQQQQSGHLVSLSAVTDVQRQHTCTCCGHILVPGCNGTVLTIRPGRTTKPKKSASATKRSHGEAKNEHGHTCDQIAKAKPSQGLHEGIRKVFTCGLCGRNTIIALPPPPHRPRKKQRSISIGEDNSGSAAVSALPASTHKASKAALKATASVVTGAPSTKSSSNSSSKRRAKNRKASLLELLEKSRGGGGVGGSTGLSFDDFRRK